MGLAARVCQAKLMVRACPERSLEHPHVGSLSTAKLLVVEQIGVQGLAVQLDYDTAVEVRVYGAIEDDEAGEPEYEDTENW